MPVAQVLRVHAYGGPEVLAVDAIELPDPGPSEVLVRVEVAGVNFMDTQFRSGLYRKTLPFAVGHDGAGVVAAIGANVCEVSCGDRVVWSHVPGSTATLTIVPVRQLAKIPDGCGFEEAAAALFQGMTAHYLACSTYPLKAGDVCVVHSAAGGVGALLCQIAKLRGATVIATVSSEQKIQAARDAGADHVVVYTKDDFAEAARRLTEGRGADVVYDAVGQETFEAGLRALRNRGLLALYGEASGVVPPFDIRKLVQYGSLYITRTGTGAYVSEPGELAWRRDEVLRWLAEGRLHARTHGKFALSRAAEAHRLIESRTTTGKLLLAPQLE
jgi:NADPH2:quinone reductase